MFLASSSPSSIRFAISGSSSGFKSGTRPISFRYILTGSFSCTLPPEENDDKSSRLDKGFSSSSSSRSESLLSSSSSSTSSTSSSSKSRSSSSVAVSSSISSSSTIWIFSVLNQSQSSSMSSSDISKCSKDAMTSFCAMEPFFFAISL